MKSVAGEFVTFVIQDMMCCHAGTIVIIRGSF